MNLTIRLLLAFAACAVAGIAAAQDLERREFSTHYLPAEVLKPVIQPALSTQGRFVFLPARNAVLVIDWPEHLNAVEEALERFDPSGLDVALDFAFQTGIPPITTKIIDPPSARSDFPVPTRYVPPRVFPNGGGFFTVIPATPTGFTRRNVGVTLETDAVVQPNGTISLNLNSSTTEFEGFINYGSGIFTAGVSGSQPVLNQVADPRFFAPFLGQGGTPVPVFDTTRVSTSIVVQPEVTREGVAVQLLPRITISDSESGKEARSIDLESYRTRALIAGSEVVMLEGFVQAPPEFNRHFFDSEANDGEGGTLVHVRARILASPPGPEKEE